MLRHAAAQGLPRQTGVVVAAMGMMGMMAAAGEMIDFAALAEEAMEY